MLALLQGVEIGELLSTPADIHPCFEHQFPALKSQELWGTEIE